MADLLLALDVLKSWEGGYAKVKRDPGGETYCGISRKNFPQWDGWLIIDSYKATNSIKWNQFLPIQALDDKVQDFYKDSFWDIESYQLLVNQDVADKIFQHHVNMG